MNFALQECFAEPLHDLGEGESRLRGIFTPASERGLAVTGVTAQFLDDAGEFEAINHSETPLVDHALGELRRGLGPDASALPPWAWDILRENEALLSSDGRRDMIFEGAVVLRRSEIAELPAAAARRSGWWWNSAEPGRGFFIDFRTGTARVACCAYDDDGEPTWSVAGQEALDLSGPAQTIGLSVGGASLSLEPQHADLASGGETGWWAEDADASRASIVVEDLGNRVMVALLAHDGWSLRSARNAARASMRRGAALRGRAGPRGPVSRAVIKGGGARKPLLDGRRMPDRAGAGCAEARVPAARAGRGLASELAVDGEVRELKQAVAAG